MAKRKRPLQIDGNQEPLFPASKKSELSPSTQLHQDLLRSTPTPLPTKPKFIQIITGSYDRVLHGVIATLVIDDGDKADYDGREEEGKVDFSDNFMFNAHESAIRCLAVSPPSQSSSAPDSQKIILASGGTDEKINLYHLSASPTPLPKTGSLLLPILNGKLSVGNPKNKELGSLLHHSASVNVLHFSTRSKLLSGAEDNTIAISRTRDWTMLSTIKAPIPRAVGQPSGDTAPPGTTSFGIVDFAIHPSRKLMISIGKGEKCMRLWNLVTGKKAGVLTFERELLQAVREGKWAKGEGRKVRWNPKGDEFVVAFERGAAVFGMDSKPRSRILPSPATKIHQIQYIPPGIDASDVLVVSTEDGRLLFYSLDRRAPADITPIPSDIADCELIGQLGGSSNGGLSGRIKDFELLPCRNDQGVWEVCIIITAGSDGMLRVWEIQQSELNEKGTALDKIQDNAGPAHTNGDENRAVKEQAKPAKRELGRLRGTYQSDNRITCLKAFLMLPPDGEDISDDARKNGSESSEAIFDGLDDNV